MAKKQKTKQLNYMQRIALVLIGLTGMIFVYLLTIESIDGISQFTFIGIDSTKYALAGIIILIGYVMSSLFKSGLRGRYNID